MSISDLAESRRGAWGGVLVRGGGGGRVVVVGGGGGGRMMGGKDSVNKGGSEGGVFAKERLGSDGRGWSM